MTPVLPVAKAVYLCDDVIQDPASRKIHLLGVFNAIRLNAATTFPFTLAKLCVFVQLADGMGDIPFRIEIIHAETDTWLYHSPERTLHFPDRRATVYACQRILDLSFTAPGVYLIEFYLQGAIVDDCLLPLILE